MECCNRIAWYSCQLLLALHSQCRCINNQVAGLCIRGHITGSIYRIQLLTHCLVQQSVFVCLFVCSHNNMAGLCDHPYENATQGLWWPLLYSWNIMLNSISACCSFKIQDSAIIIANYTLLQWCSDVTGSEIMWHWMAPYLCIIPLNEVIFQLHHVEVATSPVIVVIIFPKPAMCLLSWYFA